MIELRWGKKITYLDSEKRRNLFRISSNSIHYRNLWLSTSRYFLKYNKTTFAICWPSAVDHWDKVKWIFGWRYHPKVNVITGLLDGLLIEVHFGKLEVALYR